MPGSIPTMSRTDPAFEWADEPVAVNPHGKLRRLAEQRGWAIEDWG